MAKSDRVTFTCDGGPVDVPIHPGETLLSVLRERLGIVSVKDGCAPQGQCGCCTVLVDGSARVACVTPAERVEGRRVDTVDGIDASVRDSLVEAFTATGASQCGFCTPGILVRAAALLTKHAGAPGRMAVDRALAAHLCRCTGWCTIHDAIEAAAVGSITPRESRDLDAASRRAELEGGGHQRVGPDVPIGAAGFADDTAPRDALVAVPARRSDGAETIEAAGARWVVADSLDAARAETEKVQGRRTSVDPTPPHPLPARPDGGVVLATSWVEPAYLEPDASWCAPGTEPASPLANGGAFGGKESSLVTDAARALSDATGGPVRVVLSREDVVRLGPKRPPIAASAIYAGGIVRMQGVVAGALDAFEAPLPIAYALDVVDSWTESPVDGPPVSAAPRATGIAERTVLLEGALAEAGVDRAELVANERAASVLLDTCAATPSGALAGARAHVDPEQGTVRRIDVRVAAGDALDHVVLRSYCIGAAHMALGWVLSEGIAVDDSGEVLDLTIRSFGVIRSKDTPPIEVTIVDDPGEPRARASDAVFAAVAGAVWNAIAAAEGVRPESFPALATRAARRLRA